MNKILVTGGKGLVASAIERASKNFEYEFKFITHKDYDLKDTNQVKEMFESFKPDYVIHTAAKVGGIGGNMAGHADYFYDNILINTNVIHHCHLYNVKKLLAFSSVCVFPDDIVLLKEEVMHNGPPFSGNFAYAYAKRMVDIQIRAYKSQYHHKNWCSIIPGNIYGTNDLYSLTHGHVVPSLIHKLYLVMKNGEHEFPVWGDGKSLREFIFSDDLANILLQLIGRDEIPERLIVSGNKQYFIGEIVKMLLIHANFQGQIVYDNSKPNGQRNRQSDLSQFNKLFPTFKFTDINDGLKISYNWFQENYPNVRIY